ncbi:A-agglutinin anchorage subunit-like isoform X1 [Drosophila grimshawi]|uniref:A-agglutinin anchorage subunit-like isoform X1 n=1 Tax=Drosophila grimshawi TaxID=7222 RepID=UPI000C870643|nr:A-agglutinin anchorage subunit-like isoform X1 [Drosophila grimshawi]
MRLHFVTHCLLLSTILTIGTKGETFHLLLSKSRELSSLKSGHKSLTTEPPVGTSPSAESSPYTPSSTTTTELSLDTSSSTTSEFMPDTSSSTISTESSPYTPSSTTTTELSLDTSSSTTSEFMPDTSSSTISTESSPYTSLSTTTTELSPDTSTISTKSSTTTYTPSSTTSTESSPDTSSSTTNTPSKSTETWTSPTSTTISATTSITGFSTLTTPNKNNIESEKLNVQIEHILYTSRTGHFIGNTEFDHQSAILRHAASLDSDFLHVKIREYYKFLSYNSLRLKLEADLQSRIAVTESYLQAEKIGDKCRAFYQNQKWELRRALNEPNFLKSHKLRLHSEKCPHKQTEDSEETEEDEDFCLFCTNWFPFKK